MNKNNLFQITLGFKKDKLICAKLTIIPEMKSLLSTNQKLFPECDSINHISFPRKIAFSLYNAIDAFIIDKKESNRLPEIVMGLKQGLDSTIVDKAFACASP